MVWKQDLAKLKQQLGPDEPAPAAKPLPKPAPKPTGPTSLAEEDAVFLSAMGLRAAPPRPAQASDTTTPGAPLEAPGVPAPAPITTPPPPAPAVPETFEAALKDLKGLKPLARGLQHRAKPAAQPDAPITPPVAAASPEPPPLASLPEPPAQAPAPALQPPVEAPTPELHLAPVRFQLAAGMALEVDGVLDLRGHSLPDAVERLKDRLGDGQLLGWRSLQVILGSDPKLHEGLLELLASGQATMVTRYAQAPVPMGGSQAWLLYFGPTQSQS